MEASRTHCDSPHVRAATNGGRVVGEISHNRPADASRDKRSLPILPVVTPRQRAIHPRAELFDKPHAHRTPCGHGAACDPNTFDCRKAACVTCAPRECSVCRATDGCRCAKPTAKILDLGGRRIPLQHLEVVPKITPLNPRRKPKNGRKRKIRASA